MIYMGSKNRIAKHLLPFMVEAADNSGIITWVEPFVGGGNMRNYTSTFDLEMWSKYDNTTKTYQVAISYVNPSTYEWYSEIISAKTFYGLLFKLHFRELTRNSKTKSTDIIGDLSYTKESLWKSNWCKDRGLDEYNRVNWRDAKRAYKETL